MMWRYLIKAAVLAAALVVTLGVSPAAAATATPHTDAVTTLTATAGASPSLWADNEVAAGGGTSGGTTSPAAGMADAGSAPAAGGGVLGAVVTILKTVLGLLGL